MKRGLGALNTLAGAAAIAAGVVNAPKNVQGAYFHAEGVGSNDILGTERGGVPLTADSRITADVSYDPANFQIVHDIPSGETKYSPITLGADYLSVTVQTGAQSFRLSTNNFSIYLIPNGGNGTNVRFSNTDSADPLFSATGEYGFSTLELPTLSDNSLANISSIIGNTNGNVYAARYFNNDNTKIISPSAIISVPEPASLGLLSLGSLMLLGSRRLKNKHLKNALPAAPTVQVF